MIFLFLLLYGQKNSVRANLFGSLFNNSQTSFVYDISKFQNRTLFETNYCADPTNLCLFTPKLCSGHEGCSSVLLKRIGSEIDITLFKNSSEEDWVGFGFSFDRQMGVDDVYYCVRGSNGVNIYSAYSVGQSMPRTTAQTGIITGSFKYHINPTSFSCQFRRPLSVTKSGTRFDLGRDSWFVLLATGSFRENKPAYHGHTYSSSTDWPYRFANMGVQPDFSYRPPTTTPTTTISYIKVTWPWLRETTVGRKESISTTSNICVLKSTWLISFLCLILNF